MSEVRQIEIPINYESMPWLAGLMLNPSASSLQPSAYSFSLTRAERKIFKRRKHIPVSEWAEKNRVLTMSSMPGPWKNERTPHLVGIMDAAGYPSVQTVILCKSPQTGGSECVHNFIGYCIDMAPGPVLYVYPDELVGRENMRDRIQPMIESSPRLRSYLSGVEDDKGLLRMNLAHMPVYIAWARSASRLSNKPIRYVVFDETDKYPETAGPKETDPISLGEARAITYENTKKLFKISTPTTEGNFIWQALTKEAQVIFDYWVKCPHCARDQRMIFTQIRWAHKIEPGADGKYHSEDPEKIESEKLAWYQCAHCNAKWDDYIRNEAVRTGGWRSRVPEESNTLPIALKTYLDVYKPKKIGFHLPSWISPFVSLSKIAASFLRGLTDINSLKDFHNKHLAEPWKLTVISKKKEQILAACCDLPAQTVPEAAFALTCGVDVQQYGFWFAVRAWAANMTSWLIHYGFLAVWKDLETLLFESSYPVGNTGRSLRIFRAAIDTGGGKKYESMTMTEETYFWLIRNRGRAGIQLCGTKGASNPLPEMVNLGSGIISTPSGKKLPEVLRILSVDTGKAKDQYHFRLQLASNNETRDLPQAAFLHAGTGADYAAQILAEEKQIDEKGREVWVNPHQRPNHLFDADILAAVCTEMGFPGGGLRLYAPRPKSAAQTGGPPAGKKPQGVVRSKWMANR
jgi:phage terminase large subunit GpA-like protein